MILLIDSPVGPADTPERIRAWLEELQQMRRQYEGDPEALGEVDRQIERARGWLGDGVVEF